MAQCLLQLLGFRHNSASQKPNLYIRHRSRKHRTHFHKLYTHIHTTMYIFRRYGTDCFIQKYSLNTANEVHTADLCHSKSNGKSQ